MLNQVSIIGRLGKDPEPRTLPNGRAVSSFSLATTESWRDKESGEKQERTEWHNCVAFERVAEIINQYANKGEVIFVQGKLQTRKWEDKNGATKYTTEIVVRDVKLLPNPKRDEHAAPAAAKGAAKAELDFSDDIPF
jgi:single-strand DNA-binding protein